MERACSGRGQRGTSLRFSEVGEGLEMETVGGEDSVAESVVELLA